MARLSRLAHPSEPQSQGYLAGALGVPRSVIIAGGEPVPPAAGWALDEAEFSHRDGMITKSEVRALVLARLAPGPGRLVWDLGSGSGSVGVECARLGAAVVAVERDPAQCARLGWEPNTPERGRVRV
jgi:precorrin-6Y C5,15-methyltransferase (decarboxylating)